MKQFSLAVPLTRPSATLSRWERDLSSRSNLDVDFVRPRSINTQKEDNVKEICTYLLFNGNCREAMKFYKQSIGGELQIMPYSQAPDTPKEAKDLVIHARLSMGSAMTLMASDAMPGKPVQNGNNFSVSVQCDNDDEVSSLFSAISAKGKVTMPLADTFWGARFGMCTDQFGINWMFNFQKTPLKM